MRQESIYPTYRSRTNGIYILGLCFAALWLIGGVISILRDDSASRLFVPFIAIFPALVTVFFSKLFREGSLMLCDMSDASIRTAHMLETQRSS